MHLKPEPGTYALICSCRSTRRITVGRLGTMQLRPGMYIYVGSALGPGGARARIAHHQRKVVSPHWHIDALRRYVRIDRVLVTYGRRRHECKWAAEFGTLPGASIPLPGFGSSDCRCAAHLFYFETIG